MHLNYLYFSITTHFSQTIDFVLQTQHGELPYRADDKAGVAA